MTNVGGATNIQEARFWNMINISTKYGCDSGTVVTVDTDETRQMMNDGRRTIPGVWHKLPTGELKIIQFLHFS